jgi:hypothetical protein
LGERSGERAPPALPILLLLAAWLLLEALLLVRWTAATEASSGRLLFPALGSVALLVAFGVAALAGPWQRLVSGLLAVVFALGGALALPLALLPAYAAPVFVPTAELHPALALGYRYGNLELVGATLPPAPLVPGSTVTVTLDWATVGPIAQNDVVSVQLFGPAGVRVEALQHRSDAFPGGGAVLTSRWPAGMGLVDAVPIHLRSDIPAPSLVHVDVFVYPDGRINEPVPVRTANGEPISPPELGRLVYGRPAVIVPVAPPPLTVFGGQIALQRASIPPVATAGSDLAVQLRWQALTAPKGSYTVFVHLGPLDQQPLAQHDQQPLAGKLPTTEWVPGEVIDDVVDVPLPAGLPAGSYDVSVGLYQSSGGARLVLTGGATQFRLGSVRIAPRAG